MPLKNVNISSLNLKPLQIRDAWERGYIAFPRHFQSIFPTFSARFPYYESVQNLVYEGKCLGKMYGIMPTLFVGQRHSHYAIKFVSKSIRSSSFDLGPQTHLSFSLYCSKHVNYRHWSKFRRFLNISSISS